jgi:hypothetical protein
MKLTTKKKLSNIKTLAIGGATVGARCTSTQTVVYQTDVLTAST